MSEESNSRPPTQQELDAVLRSAEQEYLVTTREFAKSDRYSDGKRMLQLVEQSFVDGVADVLTMGAEKYAPDNWKLSKGTPDHDQFVNDRIGSLLRHLSAYRSGEMIDEESGLPHLDHIACNIMFIRYYDGG